MTLILNGTDNSASSPAVQGGTAGTTTGVYYPNTNQVALATAGVLRLLADANGNIGVALTPSAWISGYTAIEMPQMSVFSGAGGGGFILSNLYLNNSSQFIYKNSGLASTSINTQGGAITLNATPSGTAGTAATMTQIFSVEKDTSIALQGATTKSGTGITFPATQLTSSNANTLDDYEEGTWTPTDNSGAGLTITNNGCTYTKIGDTVSIRAYLSYPSTASGAAASLAGLPFTTANWGGCSIMSSGSPNAGIVRAVQAQTTFDIKSNTSDGALSNANLSNTFLIFNLTYKVA